MTLDCYQSFRPGKLLPPNGRKCVIESPKPSLECLSCSLPSRHKISHLFTSSASLIFYSNFMPMSGTNANGSSPVLALPFTNPSCGLCLQDCSPVPESTDILSEPRPYCWICSLPITVLRNKNWP